MQQSEGESGDVRNAKGTVQIEEGKLRCTGCNTKGNVKRRLSVEVSMKSLSV